MVLLIVGGCALDWPPPPSFSDGTSDGDDVEETDVEDDAGHDGDAADVPEGPWCGDGILDPGEECDDGNTTPGDGCGGCNEELGWECDEESPSHCDTVCGDGRVMGDEECDDGDGDNTDRCPDGEGGTCLDAFCGDGHVWEGNEECDDGDTVSLDGCSAVCEIECLQGENVALSATPSSSGGGTAGWGIGQLNNGQLEDTCNFHWVVAGSTPGDAYFQLEWSAPQTLWGMWLDTNYWENTTCYLPGGVTLAGGTIEWWNGGGWVAADSIVDQADDWGYEFDEPVTTTRLRIFGAHATDLGGQTSNPLIYEWEVYECTP
ncbi:MAG: DUF4215 domain-containing protein [Deltaproteobacteria bacterium]|nr:DUF4215 domain-containing protein [Deltaproteobacteria bacterium]